MIGTTGKGWLCTMSDSPDSVWGDVDQFYEDMEAYANDRKNETDLIIVESQVWGKLKTAKVLPMPGDGFSFYHSTRAKFPTGDITLACKLLTNSEGKQAVFRPFARKFCE